MSVKQETPAEKAKRLRLRVQISLHVARDLRRHAEALEHETQALIDQLEQAEKASQV